MHKDDTPTHQIWLPLAFIAVAVLALIAELSLTGMSFSELAKRTYSSVANVVSISAGIPTNEYNTLAAQFDAREKELDVREAAILAKEGGVLDGKNDGNAPLLYMLGGVTVLLTFLLLVNFYYDIQRGKSSVSRSMLSKDPISHARPIRLGGEKSEFSTRLQ